MDTEVDHVQLQIFCRGLAKKDVNGDSDPFVGVFIKNSPKEEYKFVSRTEEFTNEPNPDFKTLIKIDYFFEK